MQNWFTICKPIWRVGRQIVTLSLGTAPWGIQPRYSRYTQEAERLNFLEEDDDEDNYEQMDDYEEPVGRMTELLLSQALQERLKDIRRYGMGAGGYAAVRVEPKVLQEPPQQNRTHEERMTQFALTPFDKGYYDVDDDYDDRCEYLTLFQLYRSEHGVYRVNYQVEITPIYRL